MAVKSIIEKEFHHILRDYRTLIIIFIMPVLQMIIFGYALNMELQNITISIDNQDRSFYSRQLIRKFQGSKFFKITTEPRPNNIEALFFENKIRAYVTIPKDFSKNIKLGRKTNIDVMIDASNSNEAILIKQYISSLILLFAKELSPQTKEF